MRHNVYPELVHLENKLYYSQNREDLILEAFFPDLDKGFYIDVGAYDPDFDSVTKLFYKKGWRGINIEPQAERYRRFVQKRRRDINLNCGVSSTDQKAQLRVYKNGGLSTFSPEIKKEYNQKESEESVSKVSDVEVEMRTLKSIFHQYNVEKIDFMKIDVEGLELEVLEGNDWTLYRPEVICIEANHMVRDWKHYIRSFGYILVFFDGLNEYYASSKKVAERFDYVAHIIVKRGGGMAVGDYQVASGIFSRLERELNLANVDRQHLQYRYQGASERLGVVGEELKSIRFLAARLMRVIFYKMQNKEIK